MSDLADLVLERIPGSSPRPGPLVLVVMDGVGLGRADEGNAVHLARTPVLDNLLATHPQLSLRAHGTAVGLPSDDDMGNSEVGHNALGSGRIFAQGAKLVNEAIASGRLFEGAVWRSIVTHVREEQTTLHFLGLLSDGNVHSHIDHLEALLDEASSQGVERVRIHTLLDGRDVPETSALLYVDRLETKLATIRRPAIPAPKRPEKKAIKDLEELEAALASARSELESARAHAKTLAADQTESEKAAEEWEKKAMNAVRDGDDALALLYLENKKQQAVHALRIAETRGEQAPLVLRLEHALAALALRVDVARTGVFGQTPRDYKIASGGGRMRITMDRYEADWGMVERGYDVHVRGRGLAFPSARAAIEALREQHPGVIDQDLPPFVVVDADFAPVGRIEDGDAVVLFNFRGDRAIEISRAFEESSFSKFDRGRRPEVLYAGMMQYDGDYKIPRRFLVDPPAIQRTMGEYLARAGVRQLAISETQKFGHVTYFWNGNRGAKFDEKVETWIEIPSDRVPFEQRPWMKAAEITDAVIEAIERGEHRFIRLNYANGDMVGHTGARESAVLAVQVVDLQLGRLEEAVKSADGLLIVTADHGNADEMWQRDPKTKDWKRDATGRIEPKTSHTLNPVPFVLFDPRSAFTLRSDLDRPGLANVAATVLELLGFAPPPGYEPSLLGRKSG
ncbi:MAG: hypothetical protein HYV07_28775 [Deltaproteobacteria bacterium]|nr:hypothetical protein [Deltaproteobacteria bacterium]